MIKGSQASEFRIKSFEEKLAKYKMEIGENTNNMVTRYN